MARAPFFLLLELESNREMGRTYEAEAVSEEQIIGILKEAASGAVVMDLCRRHGISSASYYSRKAKFGGFEVSDAKRLRALEEERSRPSGADGHDARQRRSEGPALKKWQRLPRSGNRSRISRRRWG